jgi:putative nucleotidyltransferase with HDIG domain
MSEKIRILFVDDDRSVLDGLRRMLHKMSRQWKMEFVTRPAQALKVMRETHYDIIISDLKMPDSDGIELLEKVRKRYPDTIRFMLSGYSDQPLQGRAAKCVHQFISKPYSAENLTNLIMRAITLRDRLRSKEAAEVLSKLRSLPVMPNSYQSVIDCLADPQVSTRKVGELISKDIGMSAKMMQLVNSSFYGLGGRIVDPVHAVVYLGLKSVEALILTSGVFSKLSDDKAKQFFVTGLQEHCVRVGSLARHICMARNMSEDEVDTAAMAGILHDAGKMVLIARFPEQFEQAIEISRSQNIPLYEAEYDLLNINHAELGGCLLDLWGLPNPIIEAATFHHEPWLCPTEKFSVASAVYAANNIDHQLCAWLKTGAAEPPDHDYLEKLSVIQEWPQWRAKHLQVNVEELEYVC